MGITVSYMKSVSVKEKILTVITAEPDERQHRSKHGERKKMQLRNI